MNRSRLVLLLAAASMVGVVACSGPSIRLATATEIAQAQVKPTPAATTVQIGVVPAPSTTAPIPGSGALNQFQEQLRAVSDAFLPSIVEITTNTGLGSGIVFDASGDIVTNYHVVEGAKSLTITASDGKQETATIVGTYANNDLAVIHVAPAGDLTPATFADASLVKVGDVVLAVGSPFGLGDTVTEGIISAIGRTQSEGNGVVLSGLLQTSAPINPGNSGGALVDLTGKVVGIPTLAGADSKSPNQTTQGIGFAINSTQVTTIARQLISGGTVTHTGVAYIGVTTKSTTGGAGIGSVATGSPAEKAGIQAGWTITAVGGHSVPDTAGLSQVLAGYKPGDKVQVSVTLADGSKKTVTLTLGERPANP